MKILLPFIILIFVFGVSAQVRKAVVKPTPKPTPVPVVEAPPTQKVIVEKTNGDKLTGLLVKADSETLTVQISETNLPVKFSEIKAVWFGEIPAQPVVDTKKDKEQESIQQALKSLRKLSAATEVGVSFVEYSRRLIDVKSEVAEYLSNISDGYIKDEINAAMEAYADASTGWNEMGRNFTLFPSLEPGKYLQKKYGIPTDRSIGMDLLPGKLVLSTIWAVAKKHIENAQNGKPQ